MKENAPVLYPTVSVGTKVTEYSDSKSTGLPEVLSKYHDKIFALPDSYYTISQFEAKVLNFLAKSIGAKRVLEIGVYQGFSSMVWANAVGADGKVTGLEYDAEYAEQARRGIKESGFSNIEIIVGDAAKTLPNLEPSEPYDLIFIDADKTGYPGYLRTILERSQPGSSYRLLREGGLVVADNVLRRGLVADSSAANPNAGSGGGATNVNAAVLEKLEEFNATLASHERLESVLLPLFDGLGLGRLVD